jgi:hypothetical protein
MTRFFFAATVILLFACNNTPQKSLPQESVVVEEKPSFIPVTAYIKGQIRDITERGMTPMKFTTINNHTDSALVKFSELDSFLKNFLEPEVDSVNMVPFFTESKFLDQTINAFTFTYNPKVKLPDSLSLTHWDVYIDPETSKIKRVYMTKKSADNKTLQLTWEHNQSSKITTISNKPDGSSTIEKEEKIFWDHY